MFGQNFLCRYITGRRKGAKSCSSTLCVVLVSEWVGGALVGSASGCMHHLRLLGWCLCAWVPRVRVGYSTDQSCWRVGRPKVLRVRGGVLGFVMQMWSFTYWLQVELLGTVPLKGGKSLPWSLSQSEAAPTALLETSLQHQGKK